MTTTTTAADGTFTLSVGSGTHQIGTRNTAGLIDELFNDIQCPELQCIPSTGVSVTAGATSANVNFALTPGGRLGGTVTAPQNATVTVSFLSTTRGYTASAQTDSSGNYLSPGLPNDSYWLRTSNGYGLIDQVYRSSGNINCSTAGAFCSPADGTPVTVSGAATTGNHNFTMVFGANPVGRITGTVRNASTSQVVGGVKIDAFNSAGSFVAFTQTFGSEGTGTFTFGLAAGTYYLRTFNLGSLIDQVYDGVVCAPGSTCPIATIGTPLTVTAGRDTVANFNLSPGGRITGTVRAAGSGAVIPNANLTVYSSAGWSIGGGSSGADGTYTMFTTGLTTGTYFLKAAGPSGSNFVSQLYSGQTCSVCVPTTATPIQITVPLTTTGIDFSLVVGGTISGTVSSASGPVANANVTLLTTTGTVITGVSTNSAGAYSFQGLTPAAYGVRATPPFNSSLVSATVNATVTASATTTANIVLPPGGTIRGVVTNATTGAVALGASVTVYDAAGAFVRSAETSNGEYAVNGLATGSYFARTLNLLLIDELHNDIPCPGGTCTVTSGAPIAVTAGATTTVNFGLRPGATLSGQVTNTSTGAAVQVQVRLFSTTGSQVAFDTSIGGFYVFRGLPTGSYFLRTTNTLGLVDELHSNIPCPGGTCSVTAGTPITLTEGSTATVDVGLEPGATITGTVTSASGTPLSGVSVLVLTPSGSLVRSGSTNPSGVYAVNGLAAGAYLLQTSNSQGFIDEVHNNVSCPQGSCTTTFGTAVAVAAGGTATVNFSLDPGATVQGTITNAGTAAPAGGARVWVRLPSGSFFASATANSTGVYAVTGLPAGTYFLTTVNSLGLVDQLHAGITCLAGSCSVEGGTPITIASGQSTTVNFSLEPGARLTGTVTSASGTPLSGVSVAALTSTGGLVRSSTTSALGVYTVNGLAAGAYLLRTSNSQGFIDEVHDNLSCPQSSCTSTFGTAVPVTAGGSATVNFSLDPGATVQGTITNAGTAAPAGGARVWVRLPSGSFFASATANSTGVYAVTGLPAGTYFLTTVNSLGLVDQLHAGITCLAGSCSVEGGTPITIASGQSTTVNFSLESGARISGTISSAAGPAPGVAVSAYTPAGQFAGQGTSGADGTYTVMGLTSGAYNLVTANSTGLIDELYNDLPCPRGACTFATATLVTVTVPTTTTIDFSLTLGGSISGTVRNSATTTAASGVSVLVNTLSGTFSGSSTTSADGTYTVRGLPAGKYIVRTSNSAGLVDEVHENITCEAGQCVTTGATPVAVVLGGSTTVDFELALGGRIGGVVRDASTSAGVRQVTVTALTSGGRTVRSAQTDSDGAFEITGLTTGTYFLRTSNSQGYVDELYNDLVCVSGQCVVGTGQPVNVTAPDLTGAIAITLARGGTIAGTVIATAGGAPISDVSITIADSEGRSVAFASTDALGAYQITSGLPAGQYFARTSNNRGYIDEQHEGKLCLPSCTATDGTPITVTVAQPATVNFALDLGASISGMLVADGSGNPIASVTVSVRDSNNVQIRSVSTDALGRFSSSGLLAGTYYLRTTSADSRGYLNEWFGDVLCIACVGIGGTPITVGQGEAVTGINMSLGLGGTVTGRVTAAANGAPVPTAVILVRNAENVLLRSVSALLDGTFSVTGLPAGNLFVIVNPTAGLLGQVYNGVACSGCTASSVGTPVAVALGAITPDINFSLSAGARITGTIRSDAGAPLAGVTVQAFSSIGNVSSSATSGADGVYTILGLPTGTVTLRTSNSIGYLNELHSNIPCLNCSSSAGTSVAVVQGELVSGLDFSLALGGRIGGTVTHAVTGAPVSGVQVSFYSGTGSSLMSAFTNDRGQYLSNGLPPGTYFAATTSNSVGLLNELFDNIACVGCDVSSGRALAVITGGTATADFALRPGGRISGTVTSRTGAKLSGVTIRVHSADGTLVASSGTNGQGFFLTPALPDGAYYLRTQVGSNVDALDLAYPAVPCQSCNPSVDGSPVAVAAPGTTANINFELPVGGRLSGRIIDPAGQGVASVSVQAYSSTGSLVKFTNTNAQGHYTLLGLTAGTYYVYASPNSSTALIPQVYPALLCSACFATQGTGVTVTLGQETPDINMQLTVGGRVSGRVVNATTGAPLAASITIRTSTGTFVTSTSTNAVGEYTTVAMAAGTYFAQTANSLGYLNEVFDDVLCLGCSASAGAPVVVTAGATTGGINFGLMAGSAISGFVTIDGGQTPIQGASVQVYSNAGVFLMSSSTNDAGFYRTAAGLPVGTYYVRTSHSLYVTRLFENIACASCSVTSGTPVITTAGITRTGIDFSMTPAGRVTGVIRDGAAGVQFVTVSIYNKQTGSFLASASSSATGTYAVNGLPPGTYTARTSNSLGYLNELYDDLLCATCSPTSGLGFAVTAGATTTDINFTLARGARIAGRVQDAASGPIAGVSITIFNTAGQSVTTVSTNSLGQYQTSGLAAGRYYARATSQSFSSSSVSYIPQLFSGVACASCNPATGTPIDLTGTELRENINFTLSVGASISGRVRRPDGTPVVGATVFISDVDRITAASTTTGPDGTYVARGLTAGTFYARTGNSQGLVDRMFNEVDCLGCSTALGTRIPVTTGTTVADVNFTLSPGGSIGGTVTGPAGLPLGGVSIRVFGPNGVLLQTVSTNTLGGYQTTVGLPSGTYYLTTSNSLGYLDEAFDNVTCANCNPLIGSGIALSVGQARTGVDFALNTGGQISGTVSSSQSAPLEGVRVDVYTANGLFVSTATTNAAGTYRTGAVPSGTYYLRTSNSLGYTDQAYSGRDCAFCNPTTATPVAVSGGQPTENINFTLTFGGRISGTVQSTTGSPLPGVSVRFTNAGGAVVVTATTDGAGQYTTTVGLPTGTYYAFTFNSQGLVDEVYDDVVCAACAPGTGKPIAVTAGSPTTGINFALTVGGRIGGTITDQSTGLPISSAFVNIYSSTGFAVTQAVAGSNGQYLTATGLAPGTYFARAASRLGYISKVWNNIDCAACSPIIGTPITVAAAATVNDINFALVVGGKISGRVTDTAGVPLRNITVQVFNGANSLVTTTATDASGAWVSASGLPVGNYFARTLNGQGFIDEVFSNVACLLCPPNSGTVIAVTAGGDLTGIDFVLESGGRISGLVTDVTTGLPISGVILGIFDAAGRNVSAPRTDSAGGYASTGGLPAGTYYVRTDNDLGYIDETFNDVICIACDPRVGTGVAVAGTATTAGVNFALARGGGISGTITASDTGLPLANVTVALYNASGSLLASTVTDGAGRYSGDGIAPGSYFLRTFNLQGYIDEAFEDQACAPCALLRSTPVVVASGQVTTNRNFVLAKGGLVSGYVIDSATGAAISGATVSFFSGSTLVGKTRATDENGYYAISLPVGTYTAVSDAVNGYATSGTSTRMRVGVGAWTSNATGTVSVALGQETGGVTFGLAACTPPRFVTISLLSGRIAVPFPTAPPTSVEGAGSGALTFSVVAGTFTPGLTLAATGTITGTPTVAGTANFTLGVSDALGCSATQDFAQTILPPRKTVTPSQTQVRFGVVRNGASGPIVGVTPAQSVSLLFSEGAPSWTISKTALDWLQVSTVSGTGAGTLVLSVLENSPALSSVNSTSGTLTITGPDLEQRAIVVTIAFEQTNGSTLSAPIGQVDTPTQNATGVQGAIGVTGWVLDNIGVTGVKIYRNCLPFENQASCQVILGHNVVEVGDAAFLAGARTDVEAAFSTYPQNNRAGWGYLMLTPMLPHVPTQQPYGGQGALTLYAIATDVEGNKKLLGRSSDPTSPDFATPTSISMANDSIAKPFGAIDTPGQGQTVSGVLNNFGWALTPDSNTTGGEGGDIVIPTNGSTMTVFIDSLPVALVAYNQCRGNVGNPVPAGMFCNDDVSNIFGNATPQAVLTTRAANATLFRNLDAARAPIGVYSFNTATLSNGLHTIAWSVTDSAGRTEGIGSRFFNVLNSGADPALAGADAETLARADASLRAKPAEVRGPAWALGGLTPGSEGVWVRRGFDQSAPWADLAVDEHGQRLVEIAEAGRIDLWLGAPVEAGYLVANGTLRDLPVGASVDGARVTWAPPVGYIGDYRLALVRGAERIEIVVRIGNR